MIAAFGAVTGGVVVAYLFVLPVLLGFLGAMAFGRDRVAGIALLAVFAGFAAAVAWAAAGPQLPETGPRLRLVFVWAWGAGAVGLGLRLMRDRRHRYLRSTLESLAVLGSGAILLAVLLSLPSILAELDRMRAV